MLDIHPLGIAGVFEIRPRRFVDDRGWFSETWNAAQFAEAGLSHAWIQDNHARSESAGVLRALHLQRPPKAQTKLVHVVAGSIFDVAVDVRRSSPTYGAWVGIVLSATQGNQILVPAGFAHGYMTLEPGTEVVYKVDAPYSQEHEVSIAWDDPAIGISWPLTHEPPILSDKDRSAAPLAQTEIGFD